MTEPAALPAYSATDLFSQYGGHWRIWWETFLDGRFLVAEERLAEHPAKFARRTAAELRDVLAEWEAGRRERAAQ